MRSLVLLCHDEGIPPFQRELFCRQVIALLSEKKKPPEIALSCLRQLWTRYDSGGISCGRSLRAGLLEEIIPVVEKSIRKKVGTLRAYALLSILLGMYHDHEFINKARWYDYSIEHFHESDLSHRVWLATAAFCLDVDDVVDMDDWPLSRILALLES